MPDPSAFSFEHFDHVQLAVPAGSEERAGAFWHGVLGMTELPKPPVLAARGGCWFAAGDMVIHLGVEEPFVPARKAHPALTVRGLTALAAALEAAGTELVWDRELPGRLRFHAHDPFGNRLEFLEARTDVAP